jgi:hypothetical protein
MKILAIFLKRQRIEIHCRDNLKALFSTIRAKVKAAKRPQGLDLPKFIIVGRVGTGTAMSDKLLHVLLQRFEIQALVIGL